MAIVEKIPRVMSVQGAVSAAIEPAADADALYAKIREIRKLDGIREINVFDSTSRNQDILGYSVRIMDVHGTERNINVLRGRAYCPADILTISAARSFDFRIHKIRFNGDYYLAENVLEILELSMGSLSRFNCSKFRVVNFQEEDGVYRVLVQFNDLTYVATKGGLIHKIKEITVELHIPRIRTIDNTAFVKISGISRERAHLSALERIIGFRHGHHQRNWCLGDDVEMKTLSLASAEEWPLLMLKIIRYLSFENSSAAFGSERLADRIMVHIINKPVRDVIQKFKEVGGRIDFYSETTNSEIDLLLRLAVTEEPVPFTPTEAPAEEAAMLENFIKNGFIITE